MSISTQVERIASAKQEIIDALKVRGVNVPDDVRIEELADYVASLNIVGKNDVGVYYGAGGSNAVLLSDANGIYAKAL